MGPPRFVLEYAPEAREDLRGIKAHLRVPLVRAIDELAYQADVETRHRKPLADLLDELPEAAWEVSQGDHRALYRIIPTVEGETVQTVRVLRVIFKGTATTTHAVSRARKR